MAYACSWTQKTIPLLAGNTSKRSIIECSSLLLAFHRSILGCSTTGS